MTDGDFAKRMWDSTAKRRYDQAVRRLLDAQYRIECMLRALEQVDPSDLRGSVALPGSSDALNLVNNMAEVKSRLDQLELLSDFQPVFRPVAETGQTS